MNETSVPDRPGQASSDVPGGREGHGQPACEFPQSLPECEAESRDTELMATVSHEMRNALGAIGGATRILRLETSAGPAAMKARAQIEHQVDQMARLVEDLLDLSRIRTGRLCLRYARMDLCAVANEAVQTAEFALSSRSHRMTTSIPESPLWLQADPTRVEQVIVNLLINAAKYTDIGGDVGLFVHQERGEAVVRVCDTGIGIEPNLLPRVFDLFVQAQPSSRREQAGLGIGLALVRTLVERHGGRVTAASAGLGCGSEFTVYLPLATDQPVPCLSVDVREVSQTQAP